MPFPHRWIAVVAAPVLAASGAAAGCDRTSPAPAGPSGSPRTQPPAAEPATAPPTARKPAGRVIRVGPRPEGLVADAATGRVVVGVRHPNRLVLADARSGRVTDRVRLPGHLRHLQLAKPGGPVLVPDENSGKLLTVALPGGKILSRVRTGASPHDATRAGNGTVFAANEFGHDVAAVRDGKVVRRFRDATQPAGLAAIGNVVGLIDVRQNNLHLYDAARLAPIARLPAGAGPTHIVADRRGRLAVTDTRGDALLLYRPSPTARQVGRLTLPGTPYGIAYDRRRDRLWVTLTAANQLVEIDASGTRPRVVRRLPTVRQPNTVAVDSATGRLFVTGTHDGTLEIIDP